MSDQRITPIRRRSGRALRTYALELQRKNMFKLSYVDPETGENILNTFLISCGMATIVGTVYYFKNR